jgi:Putative Actinobacterial Holin-X, holin superfamily III
MAEHVQTEGPNMTALVGGIIQDAQQLIRQEITLARSELKQEWTKAKDSAVAMTIGGVVALVGVFHLSLGLVYLLHWVSGAPDAAAVPLWGWFLIVGGVVTIIGAALLYRGISKAGEIQVPPKQTADSLQEII